MIFVNRLSARGVFKPSECANVTIEGSKIGKSNLLKNTVTHFTRIFCTNILHEYFTRIFNTNILHKLPCIETKTLEGIVAFEEIL